VQGGFFLGKKPLGCSGFGVQQLENSYSPQNFFAPYISAIFLIRMRDDGRE
jgi:hypothetical protein